MSQGLKSSLTQVFKVHVEGRQKGVVSPECQIMISQLLLSPVHLPRAELNKRLNTEKNLSDKLTECTFITFLYCPLLKTTPLVPLGLTLTHPKQTT